MKYKVFLAWQSQNRTTSKFINAQIKKSVALSRNGFFYLISNVFIALTASPSG